MKTESHANSTKEQKQDSAAATTSTQDHTKSNLESTEANSRAGEAGHFRRWWNEYQKKMKSAFQITPLKLKTQSEQ